MDVSATLKSTEAELWRFHCHCFHNSGTRPPPHSAWRWFLLLTEKFPTGLHLRKLPCFKLQCIATSHYLFVNSATRLKLGGWDFNTTSTCLFCMVRPWLQLLDSRCWHGARWARRGCHIGPASWWFTQGAPPKKEFHDLLGNLLKQLSPDPVRVPSHA